MMTTWLPAVVRDILNRFVLLVSGLLCAVIARQLFEHAMILRHRGEVSMTLAIPYFPFIVVVGVCFAILALVLFIQTIVPARRTGDDIL